MASSSLNSPSVCALALVFALAGGAQEASSDRQELVLESGPLNFNGQAGVFEISAPRITQGDLHIEADEALATGIEFDESSEWRFRGNVRIEVGTAVMEADSAVFAFANEQLSRGELEGAPVSFSDVDSETQTSVTGRAQKMLYDNLARTLRMTGDVRMQKNKTEMRGCDIIYDFEAEGIRSGSADCSDPFRVRVIPDSNERAPASDAPQ